MRHKVFIFFYYRVHIMNDFLQYIVNIFINLNDLRLTFIIKFYYIK